MAKNKIEKFEKHFASKIVTNLEKNCLNVCNPHSLRAKSRYPKINYKLPKEIQDLMMQYKSDTE